MAQQHAFSICSQLRRPRRVQRQRSTTSSLTWGAEAAVNLGISGLWFHNQPKVRFSFLKLDSVSCDPDCPCCYCAVWPTNSVRNWSREFKDGVSLKRSYVSDGHKKCFVAVKELFLTLGGKQLHIRTPGCKWWPKPQEMAGCQWGIDVVHVWRHVPELRRG